MKRCFVDQHIWQKDESELSAEESHHLLSVLRSRPGEIIEIFDGKGRTAQARLIAKHQNLACINILPDSVRRTEPEPIALVLIQAIPKHLGLETIIQKATELGVQSIRPVITERVIIKMNQRSARQRLERWQKIVLASAKQCHTAWLPEIHAAIPLAEAVKTTPSNLRLFGSLQLQAPVLKEVLAKTSRSAIKSITLVIGPEGDLTDGETKLLQANDFQPVSFGNNVLRVETAAVFGLSVLNYEFRAVSPVTAQQDRGMD